MQTSPHHIAQQLRSKLPDGQQNASWGYLAEKFPWFAYLHLLRAAQHPDETELLRKAALYQDNILRLNAWLREDEPAQVTREMPPPSREEAKEVTEVPVAEPGPQALQEAPEKEEAPELTKIPVVEPGPLALQAAPEKIEDEPPLAALEEDESEKDAPAMTLPNLGTLLQAPTSKATGLSFEPYHTVDYFASLGIKVEKMASAANDNTLDKQVKSFTEWLKTMKKLKYQPATTYSDPLVDAQARSSLQNKEVVTEAMAEVWIKQGHFDKAAQVYAKLMLQHPEKTPYFAARLQDLKEKQ